MANRTNYYNYFNFDEDRYVCNPQCPPNPCQPTCPPNPCQPTCTPNPCQPTCSTQCCCPGPWPPVPAKGTCQVLAAPIGTGTLGATSAALTINSPYISKGNDIALSNGSITLAPNHIYKVEYCTNCTLSGAGATVAMYLGIGSAVQGSEGTVTAEGTFNICGQGLIQTGVSSVILNIMGVAATGTGEVNSGSIIVQEIM